MKRFVALITSLAIISSISGQQVVLTSGTHGLAPGHVNEMIRADYPDPGSSGKNQVWDLSEMKDVKDFSGFIAPAGEADGESQFSEANVVLNEEGTRFLFCQEEDMLTAWGTITPNGHLRMKYRRPYIKMKYPFTYGDEFSGNYEGTYYLSNQEAPLLGNYQVKADGYGKLILPGGTELSNTLRVTSARSYDIMLESGTQSYEIVTYRWYSKTERFPVVVILVTRSTVCNPEGNFTYSAYYRLPGVVDNETENIPDLEQQPDIESPEGIKNDLIRVYPNPVEDQFRIDYNVETDSKVYIELFDLSGSKIAVLVNQYQNAGSYSESFSTKRYELEHGIYHIRGYIGNRNAGTTFIRE